MSKVLYIKANPNPEGSRTVEISDKFIEEYKKLNPNDEVITLDLYNEDIDFLNMEDLNTLFSEKDNENTENKVLRYAYQFKSADKFVFSAPMWNLSFPAILKAYMDYVTVSGITFKYTSEGPVGLCTGKKAVYVATRGSVFSSGPAESFEMGERYMKALLGFLGVYNVETIIAEGLDSSKVDVAKAMEDAIVSGKKLAENF
ncbi:FMN-dependent NADH-azoreductase [Clostridium cylindrosporum]|uniref:FMN dependent NADH:quinone oxidoreductase n=1 Tax=Clostridium cylindrosporum DSM 605 TaxID=1121307 RepID=A0A0J8D478_CLOCY|nr:FMN-dependent NADH-azoreductase [Clostridium cylindrosporum]KMT20985.1 FMN-dependent NADH-azoreductase AzoR [Clostridium cylindrosporum DSM 605]